MVHLGYKIITIGYPGLYRSLKGMAGHGIIDYRGMTFEKSKAEKIGIFSKNIKI